MARLWCLDVQAMVPEDFVELGLSYDHETMEGSGRRHNLLPNGNSIDVQFKDIVRDQAVAVADVMPCECVFVATATASRF